MDQYTAYVIIAVIAAAVVLVLALVFHRLWIRFRHGKTEVEIKGAKKTIPTPAATPPSGPTATVTGSSTGRDITAVAAKHYEHREEHRDEHREYHRHVHYHVHHEREGTGVRVPVVRQLPSPPRDFVGRAHELDDLRREILKRGAIISCRGMGGVGKTALALILAHEIKDHYPDAQIFFNLRGTDPQPLAAADAMAHVVRSFHPEARLPEDEAGLSTLYCSVLEGKRVLLLMDNAAGRGQVAPLVPPETCLLLVTTRHHFALEGLYSKDLDVLPPEDARKLLLEICLRIGDAADRIATLCGRLPLALRAAASLLAATPNLKPQDYVARREAERTRLKNLGTEGVDISVEASFGLSFNALEEEAKRVFLRLSVFPTSFDAEAEEAIAQDPGHGRLTDLVRWSLVEYDAARDRYRLHDLVRVFAAARLPETERKDVAERHARYYLAALVQVNDLYKQGHGKELEGLALFDGERENIEAGWQWAKSHAGTDEAAARLCSTYPDVGAYVLNLRQHPREQIAWLESALAAARKLKDRAAEGIHLGNLGTAYADLGETRRAIEYYEQHLKIAREIGDKRGEGTSLGNLGIAYFGLGETRRAIEYYEKHLQIAREIGDKSGEGNALRNLGIAYNGLGETRRAIEYYEKAMAIAREIGDRCGEANALGNLGNAYADLGETRRAIGFYEQALAIAREIGDKRGEGNALGSLGNAYSVLGETRRAIEYHEKALAILRKIGDKRAEGQDLGNLGNAYSGLGETRRAIEYYEQHLKIARELGDRRGEGNALYNMADEYAKLGDHETAVPLAEAALAIFEQIEDPHAEIVRRRIDEWRNKR